MSLWHWNRKKVILTFWILTNVDFFFLILIISPILLTIERTNLKKFNSLIRQKKLNCVWWNHMMVVPLINILHRLETETKWRKILQSWKQIKKLLLLFSYKEKATKRFRELVPDVNTITFSAASSKEERRKKMKTVTKPDEFSEEGNVK